MIWVDLIIGENYHLKKRNVNAMLVNIQYDPKPMIYEFEVPSGHSYYYNETDVFTDEIGPVKNHSCEFKLYVGLTESFKYCTICNKKQE